MKLFLVLTIYALASLHAFPQKDLYHDEGGQFKSNPYFLKPETLPGGPLELRHTLPPANGAGILPYPGLPVRSSFRPQTGPIYM